MQLLVDVSVIARGDAHTGIQRVVRGILGHLLRSPPGDCSVIPVHAGRWLGYRYAGSYARKLIGPRDFPSGKVRVSAGDVFFALDLAPGILPRHQGQLEQWKRSGTRLWFFIHDLLPLSNPEWFTAAGARNFERWLDCLLALADGVICSTRAVAAEFRERIPRAGNIAVACVPLGADLDATSPTTGLPAGFEQLTVRMRSAPVVLTVGRIEPRKGHAQVISAFELLWREGRAVNLVIVGNVGWRVDELTSRLHEHPEYGKRLFWLEGASDEALGRLYRLAEGVLLPSEGEGFGLPLVEAASYGKPILARDIPPYREIAGDNAHFFSGREPEALVQELRAWLDAIENGRVQSSAAIRMSTWAESAQQVCAVVTESGMTARNGR